jgi:hypothetical protein
MVTTLGGATRDDRSPEQRASRWEGTAAERRIGMWSARVLFGIGVAYAIVMVAGFSSMGSFSKPLPDPYLAVAETLPMVHAVTTTAAIAGPNSAG